VFADDDLTSQMIAVGIAQPGDEMTAAADDDTVAVRDEPAEAVEGPGDTGLRESPCWQAGVDDGFVIYSSDGLDRKGQGLPARASLQRDCNLIGPRRRSLAGSC